MLDNDEDFGGEIVFAPSELDYIANILRGAFEIRTANGEEDTLLGDFINALESISETGECICCEESEDDKEPSVQDFFGLNR